MRIHINNLKQGDRLNTDTFNRAGLHVLSKGAVVQAEDIAILIKHQIEYVDIEPQEQVDSLTNSSVFNQNVKRNWDLTIQGFQSVFLEALTTGKFNQSMVDDKLQPFLESLDEQKDVLSMLVVLERDDVNTYNHSLKVGLLSYYIATWLGYSKEESYEISKAGCLHDIGKSRINPILRKDPDTLTDEERVEIKNHTLYGYEIIRRSMTNEGTALVALQHHEREDGSGYPHCLEKNGIHPYSQIVAVADVYVGLVTPKADQRKLGFVTVLHEIYELGFGKLNEKPVQALIQNLLPNLVGKNVQLNTGQVGTIVLNNPSDIFKPLIKVGDQFKDLAKEREVLIQEILI